MYLYKKKNFVAYTHQTFFPSIFIYMKCFNFLFKDNIKIDFFDKNLTLKMKYILFMYQLGVSILKDIKYDTEKKKILIDNFDTFNLSQELSIENINEIYKIINIHEKHKLFKTLESKDYIYETKISLIEKMFPDNYVSNNKFSDLLDDWNFEF